MGHSAKDIKGEGADGFKETRKLAGSGTPPLVGDQFGKVAIDNESMNSKANISDDGRVNIAFTEKQRRLSILSSLYEENLTELPVKTLASMDRVHYDTPPPMNVVIQIIGSRGDIQPFVALGRELKKYGHRVRVATHPTFERFVKENDLEFFSCGGDPSELMSYWQSCISPSKESGVPFVADAIIANPPSYAAIHCAEKLGIPMHLMFTMPWSPTREFPHPLANVHSTNLEPSTTNLMTYPMVDLLTWQGLGDLVNGFRTKILRLEPLNSLWAPSLIHRAKIPYTYCWSPALIPKPKDWGPHIDISGFFFLNLADEYQPPPDLVAFLAAGPPPIYIGFGSIVVKDPAGLTRLIFDAVKSLGVRALVSEGWGGLGAGTVPNHIFMLGNCPHDWLFKQVSAVVHHGGAGTTAIGLKLGRPTVIVPFFGDQAFWGRMVCAAGAGPEPIPFKILTAEKLAHAIQIAIAPEATAAAAKMAERMGQEDGAVAAAKSFHRMLPLKKMRCAIYPNKLAVWRIRRTDIIISSYVAIALLENDLLKAKDLKPCKYWQLAVNDGPFEPIIGPAGSVLSSFGSVAMGFGTALAAPPRALYAVATKKADRAFEAEASSISSTKSEDEDKHSMYFTDSHSNWIPRSASDSDLAGQRYHAETVARREKFKRDLGVNGLGRVLRATLEAPVDFSVSLAQGWHNLPRLYGSEVRNVEPVTDFSSGLATAGKQFGLGWYDAFRGFVMNPIEGAREEGSLGLLKGFGRGTVDLLVRSSAGTWALPAYALKGVQSAGRNYFYRNERESVFRTRFTPGIEEYMTSTQEEREEVLQAWRSKRFYDRVKSRGEVKDDYDSRLCQLDGCQIMEPHSHDIQDGKEELID